MSTQAVKTVQNEISAMRNAPMEARRHQCQTLVGLFLRDVPTIMSRFAECRTIHEVINNIDISSKPGDIIHIASTGSIAKASNGHSVVEFYQHLFNTTLEINRILACAHFNEKPEHSYWKHNVIVAMVKCRMLILDVLPIDICVRDFGTSECPLTCDQAMIVGVNTLIPHNCHALATGDFNTSPRKKTNQHARPTSDFCGMVSVVTLGRSSAAMISRRESKGFKHGKWTGGPLIKNAKKLFSEIA